MKTLKRAMTHLSARIGNPRWTNEPGDLEAFYTLRDLRNELEPPCGLDSKTWNALKAEGSEP